MFDQTVASGCYLPPRSKRMFRNKLPIAVELSSVIIDFPRLNRFLAILHFPTIFLDSVRRKGGRVVECT
jgi:hypothetical protein